MSKKAYASPALTVLGSVADLTRGGNLTGTDVATSGRRQMNA